MTSDAVQQHLNTLHPSLRVRRTVRLEGNGFAVSRALEATLLPPDDARCGVRTYSFQYGGSVPEGWAESRTLVLPDALVETTNLDMGSGTDLVIQTITEARADELERLVSAARDRLAAT